MKNNLFTIFTLFSVFTTYSQTKNDTIISNYYSEGLYRAEVNGKVGFLDEKNRVIIPFIYDSDTLRITGREMFIEIMSDEEGNEVEGYRKLVSISEEYTGFSEGLCAVVKDGKYGFIDPHNQTIIPFEYDGAENFRNEKAIVKLGDKFGIIDKNRAIIVEFIYDDLFWNAEIRSQWSDDEGAFLGFKDGQSYYFNP